MSQIPLFSLKDLFRSVALGVLLGWLLVSIHDPTHKRFEFTLSLAPSTQLDT